MVDNGGREEAGTYTESESEPVLVGGAFRCSDSVDHSGLDGRVCEGPDSINSGSGGGAL